MVNTSVQLGKLASGSSSWTRGNSSSTCEPRDSWYLYERPNIFPLQADAIVVGLTELPSQLSESVNFFCFLFFGSLANRIGVRWSTSLVRDWLRRWKTRVRKRRRWSRRSTTRRSLSNRFISEPNSTYLLRFMIFPYVAPIAIHWKLFPFLYLNKGSSFINRRLVPTKKRKIFVIVFRPLLHSQFIESWCFFLFTLFGLWNFVFEYINREKKKGSSFALFLFLFLNEKFLISVGIQIKQ